MILETWTDEQFQRFWDCRNERIVKINQAMSNAGAPESSPPGVWLRNGDLFRSLGIKVGGA